MTTATVVTRNDYTGCVVVVHVDTWNMMMNTTCVYAKLTSYYSSTTVFST